MATHIEKATSSSKRSSKRASKRDSKIMLKKQDSDPNVVFNMNPLFFKDGLDDEDSLKEILEHPAKRLEFLQFCAKASAEENVLFFEAVYEFEHYSQVIRPSEVKRAAQKIMAEYIVEGSPLEVNVSADIRNRLLAIGEDDFKPDSFAEAKTEIFDLIKTNFYQKYLLSSS